jgi:hypothetical protein
VATAVEEAGGGVRIPTAELPPIIISAFNDRFAHAHLVEAELAVDRGALVYQLGARSAAGDPIDATFTPGVGFGNREDPSPRPPGAVHVVEFGVTTADPTDVRIAPSELPTHIVAALDARYPGVELVRAEYSDADGTPEFTVKGRFGGRSIEATMSPRGAIKETDQALTSPEVPQPVQDWVGQVFAGATIDSAMTVSKRAFLGYQVMIRPPGGDPLEATVRVGPAVHPQGAPITLVPAADDGARGAGAGEAEHAAPPTNGGLASSADSGEPGSASAAGSPEATPDCAGPADARADQDTTGDGKRTKPAGAAARAQQPPAQANALGFDGRPPDRGASSDPASAPLAAGPRGGDLATGANATAWLPKLSMSLAQALPADALVAEQQLRQILGEIDSFAESFARDAAARGRTSQLAFLVASLAAAPLLLLDLRKRARRRAAVVGASDRSWSWVLGAARPVRRDETCPGLSHHHSP